MALVNPPPAVGLYGYTQWVVVKDLKNMIFYVRSYDDQSIRMVPMKSIHPRKKGKMPVERGFRKFIRNITSSLYSRAGTVMI